MSDDPLTPGFIPTLVVRLAPDERARGSPLTRGEVLAIRDRGACTRRPRSRAVERGYDDIDPEFAWEEGQVVRATHLESQDPA